MISATTPSFLLNHQFSNYLMHEYQMTSDWIACLKKLAFESIVYWGWLLLLYM